MDNVYYNSTHGHGHAVTAQSTPETATEAFTFIVQCLWFTAIENRKILEELEARKKQMLLKPGAVPCASGAPSTPVSVVICRVF